jgi:hypothetical protein
MKAKMRADADAWRAQHPLRFGERPTWPPEILQEVKEHVDMINAAVDVLAATLGPVYFRGLNMMLTDVRGKKDGAPPPGGPRGE